MNKEQGRYKIYLGLGLLVIAPRPQLTAPTLGCLVSFCNRSYSAQSTLQFTAVSSLVKCSAVKYVEVQYSAVQ